MNATNINIVDKLDTDAKKMMINQINDKLKPYEIMKPLKEFKPDFDILTNSKLDTEDFVNSMRFWHNSVLENLKLSFNRIDRSMIYEGNSR